MKTSSLEHSRNDEIVQRLVQSLEVAEGITEQERLFSEVLDDVLHDDVLRVRGSLVERIRVVERVDSLAMRFRVKSILLRTKKALRDLYYEEKRYEEAYSKSEEYIEIYDDWFASVALNKRSEEAEIRENLEKVQAEFLQKTDELLKKNELMEEFTKNQKLINSIGIALTSKTELSEIFETLENECRLMMKPTSIALAIVDASTINVCYSTDGKNRTNHRLFSIQADDDRYVMSYCVMKNCDIKIDTVEDYKKYVSPEGIPFYDGLYDAGINSSAVYLRLLDEGKVIGILTFQQKEPRQYEQADFDAMQSIAAFVSIAISNAQKIALIEEKTLELEELSLKDSLTGLGNRRAFDRLTAYFARQAIDFAIIFVDMNHLKKTNDNLGHAIGDRYLRKIADILREAVPFGEAYRLGGDEFAILVEHLNREKMYQVVKYIKSKCAESCLQGASGDIVFSEYPLSVSVGCSYSNSENMDAAFSLAEHRMYADKNDYYRVYLGVPESGMVI